MQWWVYPDLVCLTRRGPEIFPCSLATQLEWGTKWVYNRGHGDWRNSFLSGGERLLCFLFSDVFEKALFEMSEQGFFV